MSKIKRDPKVKGLHIKTSRAGVESWYLFYRTKGGVQRRPKLGLVANLSLTQAREMSREWLYQVSLGEDPSIKRRQEVSEPTCQEYFDKLLNDKTDGWKACTQAHQKNIKNLWKANLKKYFGAKLLINVTKSSVKDWHAKLEDTPFSANRSLEILKKLFRVAYENEIILRNPTIGVKSYPEHRRERYASVEELGQIGKVITQYLETEYWFRDACFIYALVTTAIRLEALLRLKWCEIEEVIVDGQVWGDARYFGKSSKKTGRKEQTVFPPAIMALLSKLPRMSNGLVFSRKSPPKTFWDLVRDEVGCKDLRMRDLRRTCATHALSNGVTMENISKQLNHASTNITSTTYAAALLPEKQMAVAAKMAGIIDSKFKPQEVDIFS